MLPLPAVCGADALHRADMTLRQRLCYWFGNQQRAIALYQPLAPAVQKFLASQSPAPACPHGIDIRRKARLAHLKLTSDRRFPAGEVDY